VRHAIATGLVWENVEKTEGKYNWGLNVYIGSETYIQGLKMLVFWYKTKLLKTFIMLLRIFSIQLILSAGILIVPQVANSQDKNMPVVEVEGKVRLDEGNLSGATIWVYNAENDELEEQSDVGEAGKFDLQLSFQHNYQLVFKSKGFYPKNLLLNTVVPEKVLKRDPYFPPIKLIVILFKEIPEIDPSFSEKPVGKIFYSAKLDNFDSESYFNDRQIREKIDEEVASSYQKRLDVAKTLEESGNLAGAVEEYQRAANLKQENEFVTDKIASLEEQIRRKAKQTKEAEQAKTDSNRQQIVMNTTRVNVGTSKKNQETKADNAKAVSGHQVVAVSKLSDDTVAGENHVLAAPNSSDSTVKVSQALKIEPNSANPQEQNNTSQVAVNTEESQKKATFAETTPQENIDQTKTVGPSMEITKQHNLSDEEQYDGAVKASIKHQGRYANNHVLFLLSGLILFLLLILLFRRKKAREKD